MLDHGPTADPAGWGAFDTRVEHGVDAILEALAARGTGATFFVLGWVAREHPHTVRRIADAGHEVGSHSDLRGLVHRQARAAFAADLKGSIDRLADLTGRRVRCYRAPGFSLGPATPWAFEALLAAGIEVDASIFPARHAHGGYPGFPAAGPCRLATPAGELRCFPVSSLAVLGRRMAVSGGGYFRLLPLPLLRRLCACARYLMAYLYPRDLDAGQPLVPGLSPARRWRAYVGARGARRKLEALLGELDFVDLRAAEALVSWPVTPIVRLGHTGTRTPAATPSATAATHPLPVDQPLIRSYTYLKCFRRDGRRATRRAALGKFNLRGKARWRTIGLPDAAPQVTVSGCFHLGYAAGPSAGSTPLRASPSCSFWRRS